MTYDKAIQSPLTIEQISPAFLNTLRNKLD